MKIRSGFVSNSSSSSFIVLGATLSKPKEIDEDTWNDFTCGEEPTYGLVCHYLDGKRYVVGKEIASGYSDGDSMEETETSFEELAVMSKEVKESVKKMIGLDIETKLITGTRNS